MFEQSVRRALDKIGLESGDMDCLLGGDLLNQIISANFAARELKTPFLGLYGACSTMAESLLIGSMLIDGRLCRPSGLRSHQPFLYGGAAIPFPPGDGRPDYPHRPAHRYRGRQQHPG